MGVEAAMAGSPKGPRAQEPPALMVAQRIGCIAQARALLHLNEGEDVAAHRH